MSCCELFCNYTKVCSFIHQSIYLSIKYPFVYPSVCLSVHPSVCPPVHLSVCPSVHPSVHPSIPAEVSVDPVTDTLAIWSTPILSASSVANVYATDEKRTLADPSSTSINDSYIDIGSWLVRADVFSFISRLFSLSWQI